MENSIHLKQFTTVMLIDDNFIDNFVHKRLLESTKLANTFLEFTKPMEAIDYLKLFNCFSDQSNKNFIDLILLDIDMPIMSGWDFLDEFKRICNDKKPLTTIIVLSSSLNSKDIERTHKEVFLSGFIQKPLTLEKFSDCIKSMRKSNS